MKKSLMIGALLALSGSASAQIAITEVFEGTSSNLKYVELHNTTSGSIDLAGGGWVLSRIANANATGTDINLSGTIAAGDYYVVANNATDFNTNTFLFDADQYSTTITHNGNDKYTLSNTNDGLVDSFAGDFLGSSTAFAENVVAFRVQANYPNNGDWGVVNRGGGVSSPSGNWSSVTVTASNANATTVGTPGAGGGDGGAELPVTLQSFSVE